jgi:hypothetical protein
MYAPAGPDIASIREIILWWGQNMMGVQTGKVRRSDSSWGDNTEAVYSARGVQQGGHAAGGGGQAR